MSGFCLDPLALASSPQQDALPSPSVPQRDVLVVNRAPVLTLWAALVAERLGHPWQAALGFGKAVATDCAQHKGARCGINTQSAHSTLSVPPAKRQRTDAADEPTSVLLLGVSVPVKRVGEQLLACSAGGAPTTATPVETYLQRAFGVPQYQRAKEALHELAQQFEPSDLNAQGFRLYEKFRPSVASGKAGWGARGVLDLDAIAALADDMRAANELLEGDDDEWV